MPAPIVWNRTPLPQNLLAQLPPTAIRPEGWLRRRIEAERPEDVHLRLLNACMLQDEALMADAQSRCVCLLDREGLPDRGQVRALLAYHAATADKRVPLLLLRYAKAMRDRFVQGWQMPAHEANDVSDLLQMTLWLYNMTGQKGLLALCQMLKAQAPDWMSTFHTFGQTRPVTDAPDMATDAYWRVHGPTIAASLKTPALQALFEGGLKNETAFAVGWEKLMRHHGAAHGIFNADPLLAGANPSAAATGAEAEALLHTLAVLLWAQGDASIGDLLEQVAFGFAMSDTDRQSANQLVADSAEGAVCLSEYAASLWMATRDAGLAAVGYAPCTLRWRIGTQALHIAVETNYPHENTVRIHVRAKQPVRFPLWLRMPAWADGAQVEINGETQTGSVSKGFLRVEREWREDIVSVSMPMQVRSAKGYHQSVFLQRGPLTYALPAGQGSPWQYALLPHQAFETGVETGIPVVYAKAVTLPSWQARDGVPEAPPIMPEIEGREQCRITLVPYGETRARMAQFPVARLTGEREEPQ